MADFIKADRLNRLNAVVNEVAEERAQRFLGRDLEVTLDPPPNPTSKSSPYKRPHALDVSQGLFSVEGRTCGYARSHSQIVKTLKSSGTLSLRQERPGDGSARVSL